MYDTDILELKIDKAFKERVCEPRRAAIEKFFERVLLGQEGFRLLENKEDLEVIEIMYYANEPLGYIAAFPCLSFYDHEYQIDSPELKLKPYNYFAVEELAKEVILNEAVDPQIVEADDFDIASYWENQHDLEMEFLIDCWKQAKTKVPGEMLAFLTANDSSGIPIDLNVGKEISKSVWSNIVDYLAERNIHPKQMLVEQKAESVSFWQRLFKRNRN